MPFDFVFRSQHGGSADEHSLDSLRLEVKKEKKKEIKNKTKGKILGTVITHGRSALWMEAVKL